MALTSNPTGPQLGVTYTLVGPDGTRAVFNDQSDPDYVGMLTEISGFDSPEIRESADNLVEMDGGIHGNFYFGRRPITMTGIFLNPGSATVRNQRMTQLMHASNAMRGDAELTWAPSGGEQQFLKVRRQQPLRIDGAWQKTFQISLVAADPRIYSSTLNSSNVDALSVGNEPGRSYDMTYNISYPLGEVLGQMFIDNTGNTVTYPSLTVEGPILNPVIANFTTGENIALTYDLAAGEALVVDTLNHTVMLNGVTSRYSALDFLNTQWWGLEPGTNEIRILSSGSSPPANLLVEWRDAWL